MSALSPSNIYRYIRNTPKGAMILCLVFVGIIMRGPVAVWGPIANLLEADFDVNSGAIGWLSGIPVFCFAAFAPVASYVIGKKGIEFAFATSIVLIGLGTFLRLFGGFYVVLTSTVIVGAGVAFANLTIPLIATRDFKKHFTKIIGLNSLTCNVGSIFAASLTVPLTNLMGWRWAIFCWEFIVFLNVFLWMVYTLRKRRGKSRKAIHLDALNSKNAIKNDKKLQKIAKNATKLDAESYIEPVSLPTSNAKTLHSRKIYRLGFTYAVSFIFICQCFAFFSLTAWLPSIFQFLDMNPTFAGIAAGFFPALGIPGSLLIIPLISRLGHVKSFVISAVCWCALPFGLLIYPSLWLIWIIMAGFAQAANYVIVFSAISHYANTQVEVRKLSAVTQMSAYFIAGIAPSIIGSIHDLTGGWWLPIVVLCIMLTAMFVTGVIAYRKVKND